MIDKILTIKFKRIILGILPWVIFKCRMSNFDYERNILLITVGRGGSTWLSQMLSDNKTVPLFEPFSDLILSGTFDKPFYSQNQNQRNWLKKNLLTDLREKIYQFQLLLEYH